MRTSTFYLYKEELYYILLFFYNLLGVEIAQGFEQNSPPPRLPNPKKKILRVTSSLSRSRHKRGHRL